MATIADMLGQKADDVRRKAGAPARVKPCPDALHYVAAGLPGSPFAKDTAGRLRRNGRYAAKP